MWDNVGMAAAFAVVIALFVMLGFVLDAKWRFLDDCTNSGVIARECVAKYQIESAVDTFPRWK